ncbi:MAG TPA: nucleotide exchange factor GrpE, partial [Bryobacteraceae bacterium]|nr:nucleotide exchange factor GrpE [Bryobacteraceae bacterium]
MGKNEVEVSVSAGLPTPAQEPAEDTAQAAVMDPAARLAAVTAERDHLAEEKTELQDRLLRRTAEFDNYRRRVDREKSELRDYATMEAIRQLLPVVDSFEIALAAGCSDGEYARGIELIYQRFKAELQKLGL